MLNKNFVHTISTVTKGLGFISWMSYMIASKFAILYQNLTQITAVSWQRGIVEIWSERQYYLFLTQVLCLPEPDCSMQNLLDTCMSGVHCTHGICTDLWVMLSIYQVKYFTYFSIFVSSLVLTWVDFTSKCTVHVNGVLQKFLAISNCNSQAIVHSESVSYTNYIVCIKMWFKWVLSRGRSWI